MNAQRESLNEQAMRSAEEELRRRRERGRLSQARFRKRQAQASQETHEENQKMKDAIAAIVSATQGGDQQSVLSAVRAAAEVAGVDASGLNDSVWDKTGAEDAVVNASIRTPLLPTAEIRGSRFKPSGRLSPRLDYGLWVDAGRAIRVTEPAPESIPFLGAGRYSFAGQLYWACADYMISLCRIVTAPYAPSPWFDEAAGRPGPREAEDRVWAALQHSSALRSVRLVQALTEAHCEYRDTGYVVGDAACHDDIGTLLRNDVNADYASRDGDRRGWMGIAELQRHMQRQLGVAGFSRLERAIATRVAIPSPEAGDDEPVPDPEVRAIVKLFIRNLAESYTCFGDGPRWRADRISVLFTGKMGM